MVDMDGRPDAVKEQVANILRRAAKAVGGRAALAAHLGVSPELIGEWIAKRGDAPDEIVRKAVDLIFEGKL
jgi:DNA-binding transcriptional regulator YdaS (Cro superfamily)